MNLVWSHFGSEMASGSLFGALWAYFLASARKWLQEACLESSMLIFWPGLGNGSRRLVWSLLGLFSGLGPEMAPGSLFGALWAYFLASSRKWLQEACLDPSGPIFWPRLGNNSRKLVWSPLGLFFWPRLGNSSRKLVWSLLGLFSGPHKARRVANEQPLLQAAPGCDRTPPMVYSTSVFEKLPFKG